LAPLDRTSTAGREGLEAETLAGGLEEAAGLPWRERTSPRTLRRDGRLWTAWTSWVVVLLATPGAALLWIEPLTAPAAALCFAHAWAIPHLQARRAARSVVAIGSDRSASRARAADAGAERIALGLLGDLVGHGERELLAATGLAVEGGRLGVWVIGEQGALLVRPRGRRVDAWCVRVGEHDDLPGADRVAHLLLALREDELGFTKVANLNFSGAAWRVRRRLAERSRPALDVARERARAAA
jgi:hypothetical protein